MWQKDLLLHFEKLNRSKIKLGKKSRSKNDQRSDSKNPNNPASKDDRDNRSRQLNPEDEVYEKSREDHDKDEKED